MFDSLRKKLGSLIGKIEKVEEEKVEEKKGKKEEERKEETKVELTKVTQIKHVFSDRIKLSEGDIDGVLEEFRFDLIQADVAYQTSERIIGELKNELLAKDVPRTNMSGYVKDIFRVVLLRVLNSGNEIKIFDMIEKSEKPFKIVFFGVNGCGKTTTIAKFAHLLMKNNLSVVFAAGDTFRAGAIEQIEKHAQVLGVKVITHKKGADATAVIYDTIAHAKSKGIDVVLADTAGRMQTNVNLMDEMKKICRVNKPDMKIFIGDALTGNDAIEQAERFNNEVGVDAVILTKMDADIKGGSALSIVDTIKKPIIFIGMGQKYDDLVEFDKDWFVSKIVEK